MMNAWGFDAEAHHPNWISTRSIECTGELFGFINPLATINSVAVDVSSDESICNEAEMIADNMIEREEVDIERIKEMILEKLTASSQWMASLQGRFRPCGKVRTSTEREYFNWNVHKLHDQSDNEVNNHLSIQFSKFAES